MIAVPASHRLLRDALSATGFYVFEAETVDDALTSAAAQPPALIVIGVGDIKDGNNMCRALRRFTLSPIIALVARYSEDAVETLLDAGTDDVVSRRFRPREFIARVRVQLRRSPLRSSPLSPEGIVATDALRLDLVGRTVTRNAHAVSLTPLEWRLLGVLVVYAGHTRSLAYPYRWAS